MVATDPPVGRVVVLSRLDDELVVAGQRLALGSSVFPGVVHPEGYRLLTGFALDPYPVFTYTRADVAVRKTIAMVHGEHTVVVLYELLQAAGAVELELRPLFAGRDYHHLVRANSAVRREARFDGQVLHYQPYPGQPSVHIAAPGARYAAAPDWYYSYQYPREQERGLDCSEDLFAVGTLRLDLEPGNPVGVLISTDDPRGRDPVGLLAAERARRSHVAAAAGGDPLAARLVLAADQFLVRRGSGQHTILAGYHWFTDWGRDTMIALPGICLVTGRYAEARAIFATFAAHISEGMIPNRFAEYGSQADYNTVDATLWFFVALYRYLRYTGDYAFAESSLWEALQDVVLWHRRGTRYGIQVDRQDGLLQAGRTDTQLTWMDAKVDDRVVTPRQGKPVEVNALWYNALRIMQHLAGRFGERELEHEYRRQAERARASFRAAFWNAAGGYLYDVVGDGRADASLRPNQVLALSLPFALLERERARQVLEVVERELLTPFGLRSLGPGDPAFRGRYVGGPRERDAAYHQGTVWAWLLGPFITALTRLRGEAGRAQARQIVARFAAHLEEAGLGTVSEIFDGDPPHAPRGCVAQAWSVGELLRAYHEDVLGRAPGMQSVAD